VPRHIYGVQAPGKNFDLAPALTGPPNLLYYIAGQNFKKRTNFDMMIEVLFLLFYVIQIGVDMNEKFIKMIHQFFAIFKIYLMQCCGAGAARSRIFWWEPEPEP
jgi:hypothetical protein